MTRIHGFRFVRIIFWKLQKRCGNEELNPFAELLTLGLIIAIAAVKMLSAMVF